MPASASRTAVLLMQSLQKQSVKIGSQHPTRDFNFVRDTADGFLRAGVTENAVGRTVNLGTGVEVSIASLARKIVELVGGDIQIESDEGRTRPEAREVDRLLAANTLAKEVLDWSPSVSLEDGLRQTITWVEKNLSRYRPDDYSV